MLNIFYLEKEPTLTSTFSCAFSFLPFMEKLLEYPLFPFHFFASHVLLHPWQQVELLLIPQKTVLLWRLPSFLLLLLPLMLGLEVYPPHWVPSVTWTLLYRGTHHSYPNDFHDCFSTKVRCHAFIIFVSPVSSTGPGGSCRDFLPIISLQLYGSNFYSQKGGRELGKLPIWKRSVYFVLKVSDTCSGVIQLTF